MGLYREEETFKIIGICMEVHRNLGPGLLEVVYKDALEIEFKSNNIYFKEKCLQGPQYIVKRLRALDLKK
jgi:GxxExxY protein